MATAVSGLTNRATIAKALGLSLPHACQAGWLTGRQSNRTNALVYHDDAYSKYTLKMPGNIQQQEVQERRLVPLPVAPTEDDLPRDALDLRRASALKAMRSVVQKQQYLSMPLNPSSLYQLRGLLAPNSGNAEHVDGHLTWDPSEQLALSWPTLQQVGVETATVQEHLSGAGDVLTKEAVFWSILQDAPARFHRTRVQNAASLAGVWLVKLHRVMAMDTEAKQVTVSLRGAVPSSMSSDVQTSSLAMYINNLSLKELLEVRLWESDTVLTHSFDVQLMTKIPKHLHPHVTHLLTSLMQQPEGYVLTAETCNETVEALDILAAEDVVVGPPWRLSDVGLERVEQCVRLRNEQILLRRHRGDLKEASDFQLILEMDAQGWTNCVVSQEEHKAMKKAKKTYTAGQDKTWFTREAVVVAPRWYLLALLLASDGQQVPHVDKDEVYLSLLGIEPPPSKRSRAGSKFHHQNDVDFQEMLEPVVARAPAHRVRRKRPAASSHVARIDEAAARDVVLEQLEEELEAEENPEDEAVLSPSEPLDSMSSQSSPGSSSDSSSSSSSSSSSTAQPAGSAAPPAPPPPKRARRMNLGFRWGPHLFTPVGPAGEPKHWQVTCGHEGHSSHRACTKKRSCKLGGADKVLHALKFWASLGGRVDSAEKHLELWNDTVMPAFNIDAMPSLEELDGAVAGS